MMLTVQDNQYCARNGAVASGRVWLRPHYHRDLINAGVESLKIRLEDSIR